MNDKEQVIFEKFIDDHGAFLTSLSLEDNPEVIIAIMGENLSGIDVVSLCADMSLGNVK